MRKHYPAAFAAALVALAAARAWTCDDAFITFRVVEQLLAGAGPVFNVGERVQVFTHPLWLFVLTAWRATGLTLFPGAMVLCVALFAVALGLLYAAFRDKPAALAVAFASMFLCRPIVDFATGGLETPATFMLFCAALWALRTGRPRVALAVLALLPLNRLDLVLLALPFAWLCARPSWRSRAATLALLIAPAAAWMAFSAVYYGSPLPNTALAKLGGMHWDRWDQGMAYVVGSIANDAGSLALIVAAPIFGYRAWRRAGMSAPDRRLLAACAAAALLGVTYPIWTGGDFMLGRFVLPLLWSLVAMLVISFPVEALPAPVRMRSAAAVLGTLAVTHLITGQSTTLLWLDLKDESYLRAVGFNGATDERRVYIPWLGAYAANRVQMKPDASPVTPFPRVVAMLGQNGYLAPHAQVVSDIFALADPFVARIAALPYPRPGHAFRPAPPDWALWRDAGHHFADNRLEALAGDLRLIHRSPDLWAGARWRAMAREFFAGPIEMGVFTVSDTGDAYRIFGIPSKVYRPFPAESYVVWVRQYDAARLKYNIAFPHGLDRGCRPLDVPADKGEVTGFTVRAGDSFELTCAKQAIGRDGILVRIGAWMTDRRGPHVEYDQAVDVVRPPFFWVAGVPEWLVQGWNEVPDHALGVGFVLLAAAAWLLLRSYNFRFRR
jgi:arabinofuranosyltransferase